MMNYTLDVATLTDSGKVRPHNEDSVTQRAESGVLVLADGMGGYNAGEVASALATELVAEGLHGRCSRQPDGQPVPRAILSRWIDEQVSAANAAILQRAHADASCAGMGATLALTVFQGRTVTVGHVGDSRVYRLRRGELQALTRDHSLLEEQIRNGLLTREQARQSHNRNVVTRALGVDAEVDTEIQIFDVRPGDVFLLCSDGLTDMVDDDTLRTTLSAMQHNLELAAHNLVQLANDCGGRDNISVILARVCGQEHWWSRLYGRLRRAA
jgi:PPM family protein phosphatase